MGLLLLFFLTCSATFADEFKISSEKRSDIIKFIKITGTQNVASIVANAVAGQVIDEMRGTGQFPDRLLSIVQVEMQDCMNEQIQSGKFFDIFVPIYDKYFSHEEIKELILFYRTDLGKKMVRVLPSLTDESMIAGQKWGESLVPTAMERIEKRFKEEGYDLEELNKMAPKEKKRYEILKK